MSAADLLAALHGIANRATEEMQEKDVENAFLNEDFYDVLGYEGAGRDLRSEFTLPDNSRPDYLTLDANESVTAVYEFKTTGKDLGEEQRMQLFGYVEELKADYGVLTNGERLLVYQRGNDRPFADLHLAEATQAEAANLHSALRKPEWDITDPESVDDYIGRLDTVALSGELGREHFFDTFRLEDGSAFAELDAQIERTDELIDEIVYELYGLTDEDAIVEEAVGD